MHKFLAARSEDETDTLRQSASVSGVSVRLPAYSASKTEYLGEGPPNWPTLWRDLASATDNLLPDDGRIPFVLAGLEKCHQCYKKADLAGFQETANDLRRIMRLAVGAWIAWDGAGLERQEGVIDFLHLDPDGVGWAFVTLPDGSSAAVNLNVADQKCR